MQQSNVIFGMILLAFVVFITTRGELPVYLNLIRGSTASGKPPQSSNGGSGGSASSGAGGLLDDFLPSGGATGGGMDAQTATDILNIFNGW